MLGTWCFLEEILGCTQIGHHARHKWMDSTIAATKEEAVEAFMSWTGKMESVKAEPREKLQRPFNWKDVITVVKFISLALVCFM